MTHKVLVVEDEETIIFSIKGILALDKLSIYHAMNGKEGIKLFSEIEPDVVILDFQMPEMNGLEFIKAVKSLSPMVPIVIITAYADRELNASFLKEGAFRFLEKPFDIEDLRQSTLSAIQHYHELLNQKPIIKKKTEKSQKIIGSSKALSDTLKMAKKCAETDISVLIEGESGTGKELLAHFIHENSQVNEGPFIKFNGSALPETLIESELFGYEKGAFTGADQAKKGRFELANSGSIFLDEVAELPLNTQAKLLRVLQEKEFERLGGHQTISCSFRVIAATNKNLKEMVSNGTFREDLYYRLAGFPLRIPSLKERKEDIVDLTKYLIHNFKSKFKKESIKITDAALDKLSTYDWPGNIRELQNIIARAIILCSDNCIASKDIYIQNYGNIELFNVAIHQKWNENELVKQYAKLVYSNLGESKTKTCEFLDINFKTLQSRLR